MSVEQARNHPQHAREIDFGPATKSPRDPKKWLSVSAAAFALAVFVLYPLSQASGQVVETSGITEQSNTISTAATAATKTQTTTLATTSGGAQTKTAATTAPTETQTTAHCIQEHSDDDPDHNTECTDNHDDASAHAADCAANHSTGGSDHDNDCSGHDDAEHSDHADGSDHEHAEGADHDADCAANHSNEGSDHSDCASSDGTDQR